MTFQVTSHWPIFLSAIGVILGAATILPSAVTIALSIIAFVVGIAAFVHDVRELRRRWSDVDFSPFLEPFPTDAIPPPPSYPDAVYLYIPGEGRGTALVSDVIDLTVVRNELPAKVDEERYHLPRALEVMAPDVLRVVNRGSIVFDGPVVGMRGDPLPDSGNVPPITLHVADYFDFKCSNEMCRWYIRHRESGEVFDPRYKLLTSRKGHLRTLAQSSLADVVGISTVAITSDGEIVLVKQSELNAASQRMWAPAGSGSLEPRDLGEGSTHTLQEIVRRGMERELCEETGIRPEEIIKTDVVGFARWLDRGAKPEFFGVTQLSITASDAKKRRPLRSDEKLYSKETQTESLDLSELGREITNGAELHSALSLPKQIKDSASLPLLLALRAAALSRVNSALHNG